MKSSLTLIQIMIIVSVLSAIAIVAIPNVLDSRLAANETMAMNALRYIASRQEDFRQELAHNVDNDDAGEYGTFGLLSGATPTSKGKPAEPPFVDERFKIADADGIAETKGYRFRLFLPTKERRVEGRISSVTDEREMFWCAYAWPVEPGKTGRRVFFISSSHRIFARDAGEVAYPIEAGHAYVAEPLTSDVDVSGWLLVR